MTQMMSDENGAVGVVLGVGDENSCVRVDESNQRPNSCFGGNNSEHGSTKEIDAVVQSIEGESKSYPSNWKVKTFRSPSILPSQSG